MSKTPAKHRSRVEFAIPDDMTTIYVDFGQWASALQNLLENALSYSDESETVRVGALATKNEIQIYVEDRGAGVRADEKEQIFQKFYRGRSSSKAPSGTGLGLAITREIVRFHGGRVWVEDVLPHGARFVIALPRTAE